MNPRLFSEETSATPGASQINQRMQKQERHFAFLEAEWMADHRESPNEKPNGMKALLTGLLASLPFISWL